MWDYCKLDNTEMLYWWFELHIYILVPLVYVCLPLLTFGNLLQKTFNQYFRGVCYRMEYRLDSEMPFSLLDGMPAWPGYSVFSELLCFLRRGEKDRELSAQEKTDSTLWCTDLSFMPFPTGPTVTMTDIGDSSVPECKEMVGRGRWEMWGQEKMR